MKHTSLKILLSLILITIIFFQVDVKKILNNILDVELFSLILASILFLCAHLINTFKWKILLNNSYSLFILLKLNFLSLFYSTVLPGQMAGDIIKGYKLSRKKDNKDELASSVLIDRITGLFALVILGFIGVLMSATISDSSMFEVLIISTVIFVFLLIISSINGFTIFFEKYFSKIKNSFLHSILEFIIRTIKVYQQELRSYKKMLLTISLGVVYQLIAIVISVIIGNAMEIHIGFWDWCWIFAIVSFVLVLPVSFAGIGVRELSLIGSLSIFGISSEKAIAFSLVILGINLLGTLIGGLIELFDNITNYEY